MTENELLYAQDHRYPRVGLRLQQQEEDGADLEPLKLEHLTRELDLPHSLGDVRAHPLLFLATRIKHQAEIPAILLGVLLR